MKATFSLFLLLCSLSSFSQDDGEWDSYLAQYEGKLGSTLVDLSLKKTAPRKNLRFVLVTGVTFKECSTDGMPNPNEFDKLHLISDSVKKIVEKSGTSRLAGTFTHQCQRLDYYYISDTAKIRGLLTNMYQKRFPLYEPYINLKEDEGWKYYLDFLFPNEITQEYMSNSRVVTKLFEAGDKLDKPRQVDHWIYFDSEVDREMFIQYATKQNFKVERKDKLQHLDLPYLLQISRNDKVNISSISEITIELRKRATMHKGKYDGWETFVITE